MKRIVTINVEIPNIKTYHNYDYDASLQDYDIIIFNPKLPYYDRFTFTDESTVIDRTSGAQAINSINHWKNEISNALKEGKTIFFLLSPVQTDKYITGLVSSKGKDRNYSTSSLSNYDVVPSLTNLVNAKGSMIKIKDVRFKDLFNTLEGYLEYKVYFNNEHKSPIATTYSGGKALSVIYNFKDYPGNLVLIPYFDLNSLSETDEDGDDVWTKEALGLGAKLIKNFIELDKVLSEKSESTPLPDWVDKIPKSEYINNAKNEILQTYEKIEKLNKFKSQKEEQLITALSPTSLLYETGKQLEKAVEFILKQLDYEVSNFRKDSLEIDHIIISPSGKRLIGEAEGKDNLAIGIDKFRQLESNINEDLNRDEVNIPASGLLFGNGYRLKEPSNREIQFTEKCLINAKRLSTVLIQTSDLFPISMYLQDNPKDENFKNECRKVIESECGGIAIFPSIQKK